MKRIHVLIIAAGAVWPGAEIAAASDDAVLSNAPEITIDGESAQSGWYLRGDVGYAHWRSAGSPEYTGDATGRASFDESRFGRPLAGALGLGYRINDMFRTDVTAEFFASDMEGDFDAARPCSASSPAGTTCAYDGAADVRAYGLMLNGYLDIANVAGFTPYVGAGVGVTRVVWDDFSADSACIGAACGAGGSDTASFSGKSDWRFSYALMAGVTYALTDRVKLDVGYRYSDIAGGPMFRSADGDADDDGFRRHEVRAGIHIGF